MAGSFIISILSMIVTLAIGYGIDTWLYQQLRASRQLDMMSQYEVWVMAGALVMMLVWTAFSWLILARRQRIWPVSVIFLIVGLLAFAWFPLELLWPYWAMHFFWFTFQVPNLQYSGLLVAMLGILGLLLPQTKISQTTAKRNQK